MNKKLSLMDIIETFYLQNKPSTKLYFKVGKREREQPNVVKEENLEESKRRDSDAVKISIESFEIKKDEFNATLEGPSPMNIDPGENELYFEL